LRTAANFSIAVDENSSTEFESIEASLNWRLPSRVYSTFGIQYDKDDNYQAKANFSLNRRRYNLVFGASYDNDSDWQVNAGISFNVDYNYRTGQFNMQSEYSAASSTLDLLTFIDHNKNAQFDEYDEPLPNVRFGIKPYWHNIRSSRNGLTYLPGTGHNAPIRVYFDTSETKSSSFKPVSDNFRFYTHAGGVNSFDVPFNYNIMLDGVVEDHTAMQKAKFVPIQILNQKNEVVLEQLTDIENYYFFNALWPGKYTLRVAPDFLVEKQLDAQPKSIPVTVNGSEPIISLDPIVLSTKRNAAAIPLDTRRVLRKGEFYTVQFGVYNDRDYCILRVAELKSIGIEDAYYSLATKYCKVLAGVFESRQDAIDYRAQIPREVLTDGFVTIYSEIEPLFTILVDSYISEQECVSFVSSTHLLANYVEKSRGQCKVYIGDFLTEALAQQALQELPSVIKKGARVVEY
jgi:hypothetical protein